MKSGTFKMVYNRKSLSRSISFTNVFSMFSFWNFSPVSVFFKFLIMFYLFLPFSWVFALDKFSWVCFCKLFLGNFSRQFKLTFSLSYRKFLEVFLIFAIFTSFPSFPSRFPNFCSVLPVLSGFVACYCQLLMVLRQFY